MSQSLMSQEATNPQRISLSPHPHLPSMSNTRIQSLHPALPKLATTFGTILPTFYHFSRLPIELRIMIWCIACHFPRKIALFADIPGVCPTRKIEGQSRNSQVLQTCTESRKEAFKHYTFYTEEPTFHSDVRRMYGPLLGFGDWEYGQANSLYINFAVDIFCCSKILWSCWKSSIDVYNFEETLLNWVHHLQLPIERAIFVKPEYKLLRILKGFGGNLESFDVVIHNKRWTDPALQDRPSFDQPSFDQELSLIAKEAELLKDFEKGKESGKINKSLVLRVMRVD
jgi:hypothetical protein